MRPRALFSRVREALRLGASWRQLWEETSGCGGWGEAVEAQKERGLRRAASSALRLTPAGLGPPPRQGSGVPARAAPGTRVSPEVASQGGKSRAAPSPPGGPPARPGSGSGSGGGEAHRGGLRVLQGSPLSYLGK